jgi:hypothetical protein
MSIDDYVYRLNGSARAALKSNASQALERWASRAGVFPALGYVAVVG